MTTPEIPPSIYLNSAFQHSSSTLLEQINRCAPYCPDLFFSMLHPARTTKVRNIFFSAVSPSSLLSLSPPPPSRALPRTTHHFEAAAAVFSLLSQRTAHCLREGRDVHAQGEGGGEIQHRQPGLERFPDGFTGAGNRAPSGSRGGGRE